MNRSFLRVRGVLALLIGLCGVLAGVVFGAHPAGAQLSVGGIAVTGGVSAEGYGGNLPSVGVPVQDSTESVSALSAELSVRGDARYRLAGGSRIFLSFEGGIRQLTAFGFELRDYSPREWVGSLNGGYAWTAAEGIDLAVRGRIRGRQVEDRPPMPLFLQPGYQSAEVAGEAMIRGPSGILFDGIATYAKSNFLAPQYAPQIRLLDQRRISLEGGATFAYGGVASVRLFGAAEANSYPKQETFAPDDPHRRDRTFRLGATVTHQGSNLVQVGVEGSANRSNSDRPEYNAITVRALFSTALPHELRLAVNGALSAKRYLHPTEFARLLPGEEANNASLIYLSLSRPVMEKVEGTVRLGWTRAETEIGDAYFRRFGASLLLTYRP